MRHQHLVDGPCQYVLYSVSRRAAIGESHTEFTWHGRFAANHQIPFCYDSAPTCEPVGGQLLDEVRKDRGAARVMKEYNFTRDEVALYDHLIDIP